DQRGEMLLHIPPPEDRDLLPSLPVDAAVGAEERPQPLAVEVGLRPGMTEQYLEQTALIGFQPPRREILGLFQRRQKRRGLRRGPPHSAPPARHCPAAGRFHARHPTIPPACCGGGRKAT